MPEKYYRRQTCFLLAAVRCKLYEFLLRPKTGRGAGLVLEAAHTAAIPIQLYELSLLTRHSKDARDLV